MKHSVGKSTNLFFSVITRTIVFLLLYDCVFLTLYIMGNVRRFLDSTQFFLLNGISAVSCLLLCASAVMVVASVIFLCMEKNPAYIVRLPLPVCALIFSAALLLFSRTVAVLCD